MEERSVALGDGQLAHYLERPASNSGAISGELLMLPGFSQTAQLMVQRTGQALLNVPPTWRLVIMENPLTGRNAVPNYQGDFPDFEGVKRYMRIFVETLKLGQNAPLTIFGFSMGGGTCTRYLAQFPTDVHKAVLVGPAFFETMDDTWLANFQAEPPVGPAFETAEECKWFLTKGGADLYEAPPDNVIEAIVADRAKLGPGYFKRYIRAINKDTSDLQALSRISPQLAQANTPVLLITGDRDTSINEAKCMKIKEAIGSRFCTHHSIRDTGHIGGPKGSNETLLSLAFSVAAPFIFGADIDQCFGMDLQNALVEVGAPIDDQDVALAGDNPAGTVPPPQENNL